MKKNYETPTIEEIYIGDTDVVTVSDGECIGTDLYCALDSCPANS